MKADLIKELYKGICWENQAGDMGWYDGYKSIVAEVKAWRANHSPQELLSAADDRELLKRMLYDNGNGISDYGQSILGWDTFESLIADGDFVTAASAFIHDSNHDNFLALQTAMEKFMSSHGKRMPRLRLYRFASACNLRLTTVVNGGCFESVFKGLIRTGLLDSPDNGIEQGDWYQKNVWLTDQLRQALSFNGNDGVVVDEYWRNIFAWELWARYFNALDWIKPQVIKYGPPGTGKTFLSRKEMKFVFTAWGIRTGVQNERFEDHYLQLQFHPSFGYEDFIEGLRPVEVDVDGHKNTQLKLKNGRFKEFCRKAGRWEIDLVEKGLFPGGDDEKSYLDETIATLEVVDGVKAKLTGDHWELIFGIKDKSILLRDAIPPYFVLIDEINRAELSRTFGEMMFCLEYRGVKGAVSTQYSELNTKADAMLYRDNAALFFVPTNIRIIGTMNTIDRSVESFDFALRRRFLWVFEGPDAWALKGNVRKTLTWLSADDRNKLVEGWVNLNALIAKDLALGPDYQIGHAYLMNLKYSPDALERKLSGLRWALWNDSISPLLEEYLRGAREDQEEDPLKKYRNAFGLD